MLPKILIVDDEANMRRVLQVMLNREGYETFIAANGREALNLIDREPFSVIITDLKMPEMDGLQLLQQLNHLRPEIPVIIITAHGSIETAVHAMKAGAYDFITKPFEQDELKLVVAKAVRSFSLNTLEPHSDKFTASFKYKTIGVNPKLLEIHRLIDKVADSPSTVLITGESGTGKELIAHAIHDLSSRRDKPFIKVNCAAIPETLVESELFGHERGAFTGAITSKPGRFELAHEGTLFLDEIGEIAREIQVKLLRVLQDQEFERVGGLKTIKVNVRLIAATNKNLSEEVKLGNFRQDLYYRLRVIHIPLPPLRERKDDIPLLVSHFIEKFNKKLQRSVNSLSSEALLLLNQYSWPGNIRELENVLERAVLLSESDVLDVCDLPQELQGTTCETQSEPLSKSGLPLKELVRERTGELEKNIIIQTLKETDGNVTHAAERLQISRKSLQLKMKEYGLRNTAT